MTFTPRDIATRKVLLPKRPTCRLPTNLTLRAMLQVSPLAGTAYSSQQAWKVTVKRSLSGDLAVDDCPLLKDKCSG